MYYYTLSCPHSAILATVIMSEEQNSRLLRKISRLFLRIRKWFLNRPETVSSMNNIITQWTHFYSIFFRQMNESFFPNPWMSLPREGGTRFFLVKLRNFPLSSNQIRIFCVFMGKKPKTICTFFRILEQCA